MNGVNQRYMISLPQGKPDTTIPLCADTKSIRRYVPQPPQKGPNCAFYALNMLRNRIGKNPSPEYLEARRVEQLYSEFRKKRSELFTDLKLMMPFFISELSKTNMKINTKQGAREFLVGLQRFPSSDALEKIDKIFNQFLQQDEYDDFSKFLERLYDFSNRTECNEFLRKMNIDPREEYNRSNIQAICGNSLSIEDPAANLDKICNLKDLFLQYEDLINENDAILLEYCFVAASKALGFRTSSWEPSHPIGKLRHCLQSEGALVLGGLFGEVVYNKPASVVQTIEGRPIYGWKAVDRSPTKPKEGHMIVVVGVADGGKKGGFVFYVDPADGSDPKNPLQQKTYVISYENLKMNVRGFHELLSLKPKRLLGYAQYFPKEHKL